MNKEFIPYEQALELKELGFDEPCMFPYHRNNTDYIDNTHVELANYNATEKLVSAVLYQQAFRWFREKYQLYPNIVKNAKFGDWVCEWQSFGGNFQVIGAYHNYEEAELACLKKLIDMARGKEVTSDTPSNYQRGWNAAQRGLLQNDAWGDTYTDNANDKPSHEELDEWIKGWKAYHDSNELANGKEVSTQCHTFN